MIKKMMGIYSVVKDAFPLFNDVSTIFTIMLIALMNKRIFDNRYNNENIILTPL
jgi:hypothetical protein